MRLLVLGLVVFCACGFDPYGESWEIRVGLPAQPVARADLGVRDDADLAAGDVWISLHADGGDIAYSVVGAGQPLYLVSSFEARPDQPFYQPDAALLFSTHLTDDPHVQRATLDIVEHGPHANPAHLTLELEVPVGMDCDPPPDTVRGRIVGCLASCASGENDLARADDGTYLVGPFQLSLVVLDHMCLEAS